MEGHHNACVLSIVGLCHLGVTCALSTSAQLNLWVPYVKWLSLMSVR